MSSEMDAMVPLHQRVFCERLSMDNYAGFDSMFDSHASFSGAGPASLDQMDVPLKGEPVAKMVSQPIRSLQQQIQQLPTVANVLPAVPSVPVISVPISKPSLLDRMFWRRKEFTKALIIAMLTLLALSIHHLVSGTVEFLRNLRTITAQQDVALRILYAIVVLLMVWILKTISADEKTSFPHLYRDAQ
jgi:hypothetical protein